MNLKFEDEEEIKTAKKEIMELVSRRLIKRGTLEEVLIGLEDMCQFLKSQLRRLT